MRQFARRRALRRPSFFAHGPCLELLVCEHDETARSRRRTEATQVLLAESATQISTSARGIEKNAERQAESGKIIAFTGRTLATDDKAGPKYMNSPETPMKWSR